MQPVHTCTRFGAPLTRARPRWMFGFQRGLVRRWECEVDMPQEGCLPHTSQTAAIGVILRLGPGGGDRAPHRAGPPPSETCEGYQRVLRSTEVTCTAAPTIVVMGAITGSD